MSVRDAFKDRDSKPLLEGAFSDLELRTLARMRTPGRVVQLHETQGLMSIQVADSGHIFLMENREGYEIGEAWPRQAPKGLTQADLVAFIEERKPAGVTVEQVLQAGLDSLREIRQLVAPDEEDDGIFHIKRITPGAIQWVEVKEEITTDRVPWTTISLAEPTKACDCGGAKARTTHSDWCSSNG